MENELIRRQSKQKIARYLVIMVFLGIRGTRGRLSEGAAPLRHVLPMIDDVVWFGCWCAGLLIWEDNAGAWGCNYVCVCGAVCWGELGRA